MYFTQIYFVADDGDCGGKHVLLCERVCLESKRNTFREKSAATGKFSFIALTQFYPPRIKQLTLKRPSFTQRANYLNHLLC